MMTRTRFGFREKITSDACQSKEHAKQFTLNWSLHTLKSIYVIVFLQMV